MTSIVRIVRMTFSESSKIDFEALFAKHSDEISSQSGCFSVELVTDASNPNVKTTISRWDNEESLNNYRKSVLFGKVWPETKQLFSAPPEVISYISHSKSHLQ
ncbi:MAG: antibiotic biosynthesis monooxygenase [Crocinitomicaceae bacterium]|nr:antibiotic biosynthesis monooxygenase [Crocinitomicaceae bacterium]|tara:strand:+ start:191 stop:499 length:309 start_codon:yes stop_codon:yes gene_type:complete